MSKIFYLLLAFPRYTHFRDQNDQGIQPINYTNEQKEARGDKLLHFLFNSTGLSFLPHLPQDGFFIVYLWKWGNVMQIKYVTPTWEIRKEIQLDEAKLPSTLFYPSVQPFI